VILYLAADLLWATRIKSTADSLGIPCRPVRNLDMLEARLADSQPRALIIDLDSGPIAFELIRRIRSGPLSGATGSSLPVPNTLGTRSTGHPNIHILAFGPHVATDLFAAAKQAGADALLARGAFSARLPQILQQLAANHASVHDDLQE
jgi:hypothetical protein